jgi:hypothetical protein
MFETSVMAEYLRQVPEDIEDYIEYGHVSDFKKLQIYPDLLSPEKVREIQAEYARVKPRFENEKGRVRAQWSKHPISYMAEKIGRSQQYELPYSLAASIHHGNFEAMVAHLSGDKSELDIEQPPSLKWVKQALLSGHVYLLQALDKINDSFRLGFDSQLQAASTAFHKAYGTVQTAGPTT